MPRLAKADEKLLEDYGFEFSAPPEKNRTRSSRYDEVFDAARTLCMKFPGQTLKVVSYDKQSQPYNIARAINNGDHRAFKDDSQDWLAVAGKDFTEDDEGNEVERYSVWLTYSPKGETAE